MAVYTNAQLKAALKETAGAKALAAQRLGVARQTVYERIQRSPDLQQFIVELEESLVDTAEAVVAEALVKKDRQMARWFLERHPRARARGWGVRHEVSGPDGGAIPVNAKLEVVVRYVGAEEDVI